MNRVTGGGDIPIGGGDVPLTYFDGDASGRTKKLARVSSDVRTHFIHNQANLFSSVRVSVLDACDSRTIV